MKHGTKTISKRSAENGAETEVVGVKTWEQIWSEVDEVKMRSGVELSAEGYKTASEVAALWRITNRAAYYKLCALVRDGRYTSAVGRHPAIGKPTRYYRPHFSQPH